MRVRGPNNVGRAVQKFDRLQTLRNNMQQSVQTDATCNIQQCWELLGTKLRPFARGLILVNAGEKKEGRVLSEPQICQ